MAHPFGDLLREYRARKAHLSLTRLAELAGYDPSMVSKMAQGRKELTGPSGRERVVRLLAVLRDEGALFSLDEANALLKAAGMPPLYPDYPDEASLLAGLSAAETAAPSPVGRARIATPAGPPPSRTARTNNLPAPLTSLIGREHEMDEVIRMLNTTRLLTLVGAGGAGKTRLAIEVGASMFGTGAPYDAVWLVEFAAITNPDLLAETLLSTLGLQSISRAALAVLADYLRDQRTLLILDNCEHLVEACAQLALALLHGCPGLNILATSREGLNIPGEMTWRVPPLAGDSASQLFAARARAVRPDFALTPANAPVVAQICARLDGMPLAIELAAARMRSLTVEQISTHLDDVFRVLTGGSRTALPRQKTLRATIEWSYALLTEEERELLQQLSVFSGGWTAEAIEAMVGPDALALLDQLVSKSLVVAEERPRGMRYRLLETIRQYAAEVLRSAGAEGQREAHQRHMRYYAGLAASVAPGQEQNDPAAKERRDVLMAETDNVRAALGWIAANGDWQSGLDILWNTMEAWVDAGVLRERLKWLDTLIIDNPAVSDCARLRGLQIKVRELWLRGDMTSTWPILRQATQLAHRIQARDVIYELDTFYFMLCPDLEQAVSGLEALIQSTHERGLHSDEVFAMTVLGGRLGMAGRLEQAISILREAIVEARTYHLPWAVSPLPMELGWVYIFQGNYEAARQVLAENMVVDEKTGEVDVIMEFALATANLYLGHTEGVRETLTRMFDFYLKSENMERIAQGLVLAAALAHARGNPAQAARLLGATAAIRREYHTHGVFEAELFTEYERQLPLVQAALAPAEFQSAWDAGQRLTMREAVAEALQL